MELTERETEVLNFIISYRERKGYSPSLREICKGCYIGSTNGASYFIDRLVTKGAIDYAPRIPRSIVPKKGRAM